MLTSADRELLDGLVREMGPRLAGYLRHSFGRRVDVDEVVAETFCRAAGNIAALRRAERKDLYLLRVARNLCLDSFRRKPVELVSDERLEAARGDDDAPEMMVDEERRTALLAAVAELPDSQREIVVLRMSAGLTFEEIADLLKMPLGTALSRMHVAVQRLRERLLNDEESQKPRRAGVRTKSV
ncbi:MAG: sigma-70 family RNA polymerase sigma factor [Phycisphaerales bacterium]|nr:sigma-70 family RNA polymerase sigma factor [Phycisphaerales bacterium]